MVLAEYDALHKGNKHIYGKVKDLADKYRISVTTLHNWVKRYVIDRTNSNVLIYTVGDSSHHVQDALPDYLEVNVNN